MEGYLAIKKKRNQLLICKTTGMNLKCKRSQTLHTTYYMILIIGHSGKGKIIRTEKRSVVAKDWYEGGVDLIST